jgi:predicted DsbA family dithiol-disulfide isomerase
MKTSKMTVEIWSDVTCPFCYIGKRKFEDALAKFKNVASIEVAWKSFELVPGFKTMPDKNMHQFLSALKGISLEQAVAASDQVADAATQVGLVYNFHTTIPANSFNAHRIIKLAKHFNLEDATKEVLFKAYFTDGRNIDDIPTLMQLGKEAGLPVAELKSVLESSRYADEVNRDVDEARQRAITSVPSYVLNKKLTIAGAQSSEVFLEKLEKAFMEWKLERPATDPMAEEESCKIGGEC